MPEIKHTFTGGKMNKDLAIQFVPNGEYRDAMNIQVRTTSDSGGGSATSQSYDGGIGSSGNVQGIRSPMNEQRQAQYYQSGQVAIGMIADDKDNDIYTFWASTTPNNFDHEDFSFSPQTDNNPYEEGSEDENATFVSGNNNDPFQNWSNASSAASKGFFYQDVICSKEKGPVVVDYHCATQAWVQLVGGVQYGEADLLNSNGEVIGTSPGVTLPSEDFNQLTVLDANYYRVGMICTFYSSNNNSGRGKHNGVYFTATIKSLDTDTSPHTITFYETIKVGELPTVGDDDENILGVAGVVFQHPDRPLNFKKADAYQQVSSVTSWSFRLENNGERFDHITAINIVDNLLFWTDSYGEPKKINIDRCVAGTNKSQFNTLNAYPVHTQLTVKDPISGQFTPVLSQNSNDNLETNLSPKNNDLREEHVTVIRPAPRKAPTLEMSRTNRTGDVNTTIVDFIFQTQSVTEDGDIVTGVVTIGDEISIIPEEDDSSFTFQNTNFFVDDIITFTSEAEDPEDNVVVKAKFLTYIAYSNDEVVETNSPSIGIKVQILSTTNNLTNVSLDWEVELELKKPLFEHKFVRFGYRYRYEDGEFSAFSPWSELAFLPDEFEYSPRKGFNLGMSNQLRYLCIKDFIPLNTDRNLEVSGVDILFKTTDSPVCYIVKTIEREIDPEWEYFTPGTQNAELNTGKLVITSEMIHRILPEDQLLRSWDNVPRFAVAQEIVANRLVYGNYTQGYNLDFRVGLEPSIISLDTPTLVDPKKSIKSLRNYKLGLVLGDKYGRETPVIESSSLIGSNSTNWNVTTSDIVTEKQLSITENKLSISQDWTFQDGVPSWIDYVKYYIKETSNEYYNLVMDRWYDAEDGNIWLSFNSADRNKIDEETYLILKNAAGSQTPILEKARYKVIAIANEAPDFIKTERTSIGTIQLDPDASDLFLGTVDTETLPPTGLLPATFLSIPSSTENVEILQGISRGRLRLRFIGRTFNADGTVANELFTRFVPINNHAYSDFDDDAATTSDLRIYWERPFNETVNMFQRFTDAGYTLNTSSDSNDLKYFVEISEDVLENKPEFDGKFFVKIETDVTIEEHIMLSSPASISYNPIFAFGISYISTQDQNPGLNGPFSEAEGTEQQSTWAGGNDETNSALSNNWPLQYFNTTLNPFPAANFQDDYPLTSGNTNLADIGNFALGCKLCDGLQSDGPSPDSSDCTYAASNGARTKNYWRDYITNAPGDSIFIDNARSAQWMPFQDYDDGDAGEGEGWYDNNLYDDKANFITTGTTTPARPSGKYYRPPGFDLSPGGVEGTFDRITFSIVNHTWQGDSEGNNQTIFKQMMSTDGTLFRFAKDNSNNGEPHVYRVKGYYELTRSGINDATRNFNKNTDEINDQSVFSNVFGPNFTGTVADEATWQSNNASGFFDGAISESWYAGTINGSDTAEKLEFVPTWDFETVTLAKDACSTCNDGSGDYECFRSSIRIKFEKINPDTGIPYADGRGINYEEWDPRGHVRHDGTTSFLFEVVKKSVTTTGELPSPIEGACWETEPKEDVELDIYYEASDAIPFRLNEGNTTSFAPINSKISVNRIIDGAETNVPITSASGGVYTEAFEPFVSNIYYADNLSLIELKSFSEQLDDYSSATPTSLSGSFGINDIILFKHSTGAITKSKIIDLYDSTSFKPTNRFTATISKDNTYNDINESPYIPNLITFTSDDTAVNGAQIVNVFDDSNFVEVSSQSYSGSFLQNFGNIEDTTTPNIQLTNTSWMEVGNSYTVEFVESSNLYAIDADVYNYPIQLGWFNCYSFGNGVESDRVRDDFNAPQIDNGVKVSTTFSGYGEENKSSGLIYSGIYNSISETNNLNEFNQSNKITKDLNPIYGSIQALKTRDTDVVTFCEDKILKILASKDALFNADGNPQLTATDKVLGTAIPFVGDYGISKNPESLAVDNFRMYFTDKERGAVLRLSRDGLTPISNVGMKTWFRDNTREAMDSGLIGTFDAVNGEYNLTIFFGEDYGKWFGVGSKDAATVSFNEASKGWVSFKSFYPYVGVSMNGDYYVATEGSGFIYKMFASSSYNNFMNIGSRTIKHSSIDILFNDIPGSVKSFHTINYEGSQARVVEDTNDNQFYNLQEVEGWYVESFETDMQSGSVPEFINKENKWFNYIKGVETTLDNLDTNEFSVQGLGKPIVAGLQQEYISLTPLKNPINEGETPIWILETKNIPAGTTVAMTIGAGSTTITTVKSVEGFDYNSDIDPNASNFETDYDFQTGGDLCINVSGNNFISELYNNLSSSISSDNDLKQTFNSASVPLGLPFDLEITDDEVTSLGLPADLVTNSNGDIIVCAGFTIAEDFTTEGVEFIECSIAAVDSNGTETGSLTSVIQVNDTTTTAPTYPLIVDNDTSDININNEDETQANNNNGEGY